MLLRELTDLRRNTLLNPCSRNRSMTSLMRSRFQRVILCDIDPRTPTAHLLRPSPPLRVGDDPGQPGLRRIPYFVHVGEALCCWLSTIRGSGVALLVRLSVLEVCKKRADRGYSC